MLEPVQCLWIGERLSKVEQICYSSFLHHGHPVHLYCYSEIEGIPEGVMVFDANTIIPESGIFMHRNGSVAPFADLFRWKLLRDKSGYWIDSDLVCMKPFDFEGDIVFGYECFRVAAIGVLKFPEQHALCEFMYQKALHPNRFLPFDTFEDKKKKILRTIKGRNRDFGWGGSAGPQAFTQVLKHFDLGCHGFPYTYFYPVACHHWESIFDDTLKDDKQLFKHTYAVHLWNEMIRRNPEFDKDADFHPDSLFEHFKRLYL